MANEEYANKEREKKVDELISDMNRLIGLINDEESDLANMTATTQKLYGTIINDLTAKEGVIKSKKDRYLDTELANITNKYNTQIIDKINDFKDGSDSFFDSLRNLMVNRVNEKDIGFEVPEGYFLRFSANKDIGLFLDAGTLENVIPGSSLHYPDREIIQTDKYLITKDSVIFADDIKKEIEEIYYLDKSESPYDKDDIFEILTGKLLGIQMIEATDSCKVVFTSKGIIYYDIDLDYSEKDIRYHKFDSSYQDLICLDVLVESDDVKYIVIKSSGEIRYISLKDNYISLNSDPTDLQYTNMYLTKEISSIKKVVDKANGFVPGTYLVTHADGTKIHYSNYFNGERITISTDSLVIKDDAVWFDDETLVYSCLVGNEIYYGAFDIQKIVSVTLDENEIAHTIDYINGKVIVGTSRGIRIYDVDLSNCILIKPSNLRTNLDDEIIDIKRSVDFTEDIVFSDKSNNIFVWKNLVDSLNDYFSRAVSFLGKILPIHGEEANKKIANEISIVPYASKERSIFTPMFSTPIANPDDPNDVNKLIPYTNTYSPETVTNIGNNIKYIELDWKPNEIQEFSYGIVYKSNEFSLIAKVGNEYHAMGGSNKNQVERRYHGDIVVKADGDGNLDISGTVNSAQKDPDAYSDDAIEPKVIIRFSVDTEAEKIYLWMTAVPFRFVYTDIIKNNFSNFTIYDIKKINSWFKDGIAIPEKKDNKVIAYIDSNNNVNFLSKAELEKSVEGINTWIESLKNDYIIDNDLYRSIKVFPSFSLNLTLTDNSFESPLVFKVNNFNDIRNAIDNMKTNIFEISSSKTGSMIQLKNLPVTSQNYDNVPLVETKEFTNRIETPDGIMTKSIHDLIEEIEAHFSGMDEKTLYSLEAYISTQYEASVLGNKNDNYFENGVSTVNRTIAVHKYNSKTSNLKLGDVLIFDDNTFITITDFHKSDFEYNYFSYKKNGTDLLDPSYGYPKLFKKVNSDDLNNIYSFIQNPDDTNVSIEISRDQWEYLKQNYLNKSNKFKIFNKNTNEFVEDGIIKTIEVTEKEESDRDIPEANLLGLDIAADETILKLHQDDTNGVWVITDKKLCYSIDSGDNWFTEENTFVIKKVFITNKDLFIVDDTDKLWYNRISIGEWNKSFFKEIKKENDVVFTNVKQCKCGNVSTDEDYDFGKMIFVLDDNTIFSGEYDYSNSVITVKSLLIEDSVYLSDDDMRPDGLTDEKHNFELIETRSGLMQHDMIGRAFGSMNDDKASYYYSCSMLVFFEEFRNLLKLNPITGDLVYFKTIGSGHGNNYLSNSEYSSTKVFNPLIIFKKGNINDYKIIDEIDLDYYHQTLYYDRNTSDNCLFFSEDGKYLFLLTYNYLHANSSYFLGDIIANTGNKSTADGVIHYSIFDVDSDYSIIKNGELDDRDNTTGSTGYLLAFNFNVISNKDLTKLFIIHNLKNSLKRLASDPYHSRIIEINITKDANGRPNGLVENNFRVNQNPIGTKDDWLSAGYEKFPDISNEPNLKTDKKYLFLFTASFDKSSTGVYKSNFVIFNTHKKSGNYFKYLDIIDELSIIENFDASSIATELSRVGFTKSFSDDSKITIFPSLIDDGSFHFEEKEDHDVITFSAILLDGSENPSKPYIYYMLMEMKLDQNMNFYNNEKIKCVGTFAKNPSTFDDIETGSISENKGTIEPEYYTSYDIIKKSPNHVLSDSRKIKKENFYYTDNENNIERTNFHYDYINRIRFIKDRKEKFYDKVYFINLVGQNGFHICDLVELRKGTGVKILKTIELLNEEFSKYHKVVIENYEVKDDCLYVTNFNNNKAGIYKLDLNSIVPYSSYDFVIDEKRVITDDSVGDFKEPLFVNSNFRYFIRKTQENIGFEIVETDSYGNNVVVETYNDEKYFKVLNDKYIFTESGKMITVDMTHRVNVSEKKEIINQNIIDIKSYETDGQGYFIYGTTLLKTFCFYTSDLDDIKIRGYDQNVFKNPKLVFMDKHSLVNNNYIILGEDTDNNETYDKLIVYNSNDNTVNYKFNSSKNDYFKIEDIYENISDDLYYVRLRKKSSGDICIKSIPYSPDFDFENLFKFIDSDPSIIENIKADSKSHWDDTYRIFFYMKSDRLTYTVFNIDLNKEERRINNGTGIQYPKILTDDFSVYCKWSTSNNIKTYKFSMLEKRYPDSYKNNDLSLIVSHKYGDKGESYISKIRFKRNDDESKFINEIDNSSSFKYSMPGQIDDLKAFKMPNSEHINILMKTNTGFPYRWEFGNGEFIYNKPEFGFHSNLYYSTNKRKKYLYTDDITATPDSEISTIKVKVITDDRDNLITSYDNVMKIWERDARDGDVDYNNLTNISEAKRGSILIADKDEKDGTFSSDTYKLGFASLGDKYLRQYSLPWIFDGVTVPAEYNGGTAATFPHTDKYEKNDRIIATDPSYIYNSYFINKNVTNSMKDTQRCIEGKHTPFFKMLSNNKIFNLYNSRSVIKYLHGENQDLSTLIRLNLYRHLKQNDDHPLANYYFTFSQGTHLDAFLSDRSYGRQNKYFDLIYNTHNIKFQFHRKSAGIYNNEIIAIFDKLELFGKLFWMHIDSNDIFYFALTIKSGNSYGRLKLFTFDINNHEHPKDFKEIDIFGDIWIPLNFDGNLTESKFAVGFTMSHDEKNIAMVYVGKIVDEDESFPPYNPPIRFKEYNIINDNNSISLEINNNSEFNNKIFYHEDHPLYSSMTGFNHDESFEYSTDFFFSQISYSLDDSIIYWNNMCYLRESNHWVEENWRTKDDETLNSPGLPTGPYGEFNQNGLQRKSEDYESWNEILSLKPLELRRRKDKNNISNDVNDYSMSIHPGMDLISLVRLNYSSLFKDHINSAIAKALLQYPVHQKFIFDKIRYLPNQRLLNNHWIPFIDQNNDIKKTNNKFKRDTKLVLEDLILKSKEFIELPNSINPTNSGHNDDRTYLVLDKNNSIYKLTFNGLNELVSIDSSITNSPDNENADNLKLINTEIKNNIHTFNESDFDPNKDIDSVIKKVNQRTYRSNISTNRTYKITSNTDDIVTTIKTNEGIFYHVSSLMNNTWIEKFIDVKNNRILRGRKEMGQLSRFALPNGGVVEIPYFCRHKIYDRHIEIEFLDTSNGLVKNKKSIIFKDYYENQDGKYAKYDAYTKFFTPIDQMILGDKYYGKEHNTIPFDISYYNNGNVHVLNIGEYGYTYVYLIDMEKAECDVYKMDKTNSVPNEMFYVDFPMLNTTITKEMDIVTTVENNHGEYDKRYDIEEKERKYRSDIKIDKFTIHRIIPQYTSIGDVDKTDPWNNDFDESHLFDSTGFSRRPFVTFDRKWLIVEILSHGGKGNIQYGGQNSLLKLYALDWKRKKAIYKKDLINLNDIVLDMDSSDKYNTMNLEVKLEQLGEDLLRATVYTIYATSKGDDSDIRNRITKELSQTESHFAGTRVVVKEVTFDLNDDFNILNTVNNTNPKTTFKELISDPLDNIYSKSTNNFTNNIFGVSDKSDEEFFFQNMFDHVVRYSNDENYALMLFNKIQINLFNNPRIGYYVTPNMHGYEFRSELDNFQTKYFGTNFHFIEVINEIVKNDNRLENIYYGTRPDNNKDFNSSLVQYYSSEFINLYPSSKSSGFSNLLNGSSTKFQFSYFGSSHSYFSQCLLNFSHLKHNSRFRYVDFESVTDNSEFDIVFYRNKLYGTSHNSYGKGGIGYGIRDNIFYMNTLLPANGLNIYTLAKFNKHIVRLSNCGRFGIMPINHLFIRAIEDLFARRTSNDIPELINFEIFKKIKENDIKFSFLLIDYLEEKIILSNEGGDRFVWKVDNKQFSKDTNKLPETVIDFNKPEVINDQTDEFRRYLDYLAMYEISNKQYDYSKVDDWYENYIDGILADVANSIFRGTNALQISSDIKEKFEPIITDEYTSDNRQVEFKKLYKDDNGEYSLEYDENSKVYVPSNSLRFKSNYDSIKNNDILKVNIVTNGKVNLPPELNDGRILFDVDYDTHEKILGLKSYKKIDEIGVFNNSTKFVTSKAYFTKSISTVGLKNTNRSTISISDNDFDKLKSAIRTYFFRSTHAANPDVIHETYNSYYYGKISILHSFLNNKEHYFHDEIIKIILNTYSVDIDSFIYRIDKQTSHGELLATDDRTVISVYSNNLI